MAEQFGVHKKGRSWIWRHKCNENLVKVSGNYKDQGAAQTTYNIHVIGCGDRNK